MGHPALIYLLVGFRVLGYDKSLKACKYLHFTNYGIFVLLRNGTKLVLAAILKQNNFLQILFQKYKCIYMVCRIRKP